MTYFNKEGQKYVHHHIEKFFLNSLNERCWSNDAFVLLDIGGGDGIFAKEVLRSHPNCSAVVIDPSSTMLDLVNDSRIEKIIGSMPDQLNYEKLADYIHICGVLHHLVESSPKKSLKLMSRSLKSAYNLLKPGGLLMLRDECWESHIQPTLARDTIFYLLKIQNFSGIKVPHKSFLPGLEVCFLTQTEVENMLHEAGFTITRKHVFRMKPQSILMRVVKNISNVDWLAQKPD